MCTGIALPASELPAALLSSPPVAGRVYDRAGRPEVQFHWWQSPPVLPVRLDGRVQLLPWGPRDRRGSPLPPGGWVTREQLAAGVFAAAHPEGVVIPAALGQHAGAWFLIGKGIRSVVVHPRGGPVVYMRTERASNYYRNMCEPAQAMPVFVNQVI
jgi:hypothetical protein